MPDVYEIYDLWLQNLDGSVTNPHSNGSLSRLLEDYAAQSTFTNTPWWITRRTTAAAPNPHSPMIRRRLFGMGPEYIPTNAR